MACPALDSLQFVHRVRRWRRAQRASRFDATQSINRPALSIWHKMHSNSESKRRAVQLEQRQHSWDDDEEEEDDELIAWLSPTQRVWRMCETVPLSWVGGQAPYQLMAVYNNTGSSSLPLVAWEVIDTLSESNANGTMWTAEVPGPATVNLTLSFTSDSGSVYISPPVQLTILDAYALGLTSCSIADDFLQAQAMAYSGDSGIRISGGNASSSSSSSSSSSPTNETNINHNNGPPKAAIKGLASMVALLGVALLILGFFYYRLHRRMKRLQKGQSTVGNWMSHQQRPHTNHGNGEKGDLVSSTMRRDTSSSHASSSSIDMNNANSLSTLNTRITANAPDNRSRDHTWSRFSLASTAEDPFAGGEVLQSTATRHSQASTAASEAPTITSNTTETSGRPSTVGGYSFISDEHYTRQKASTISPNGTYDGSNSKPAGTRDFLRP